MDQKEELRGFLTTRRARLTPEQAGMNPFPGTRRVPGMRREEVAYLAGISVDYYTRLERGKISGVSDEILNAVSGALQLNEVEHEHLLSLVQSLRPTNSRRFKPKASRISARPEQDVILQRTVDAVTVPAFIQNSALDIVAANSIGWALFPHAQQHVARGEKQRFNMMRFQVLDPRAQDFYLDWKLAVRNSTAVLRESAGRERDNAELFTLIGELSAKSEYFRTLWASHDILRYRRGPKRYRHPVIGEVVFESQSFAVKSDAELSLLIYTVEPGSPTEDALKILASWDSEHHSSRPW